MDKQILLSELAPHIKSGMTISIGGFMGCGSPHNLIEELLKLDVKDLTLVTNDTAFYSFGVGRIIDKKIVKKILTSHIGTNKQTQEQVADGSLELELIPQGTLAERLRAATAGLGGVLTQTGLGTEVQEGKDIIIVNGEDYILEKPIHVDVALIKGYKADKSGNLVYDAAARNFNVAMAGAATITIAEVEEIVDFGELDPNNIHTPFIYVNKIVRL